MGRFIQQISRYPWVTAVLLTAVTMFVGATGYGVGLQHSSVAAAAELSEIQERGYLVVAVKDNLRPLGFRNGDNELVGLEVDLARQIAQQILGSADAVVFQPVDNADRLQVLLDEDVDLVIAHLGVTDARARVVDFSYPYYLDGTALVTNDSSVESITDLTGRSVAVLHNSTTIDYVRSLLPGVNLVGVASYQDALAYLESGQADAFAADASVLTGWVQEYPGYRLLPTLLSGEALAIAMPRGLQYESFRSAINQTVQQLIRDGWLQERIEHWGLP